jgi:hypothetical protein
MSSKENPWKKILNFIVTLISQLFKSPLTSETLSSSLIAQSDNPRDLLETVVTATATDFLMTKAPGLIAEFKGMIDKLGPKEKELITKLAILKSIDPSELTFEEVIEQGELLNEVTTLNAEIAEDLGKFWGRVSEIVKETTQKFVDIGSKIASKTILGLIFA